MKTFIADCHYECGCGCGCYDEDFYAIVAAGSSGAALGLAMREFPRTKARHWSIVEMRGVSTDDGRIGIIWDSVGRVYW
jgi:hypothetical protein